MRKLYKLFLIVSLFTIQSSSCLENILPGASNIKTASDSDGNAIAIGVKSDGTNTRIQVKRYDSATNTWTTSALYLSDAGKDASDPQIYINKTNISVSFKQDKKTIVKKYDPTTDSWKTVKTIFTDTKKPKTKYLDVSVITEK